MASDSYRHVTLQRSITLAAIIAGASLASAQSSRSKTVPSFESDIAPIFRESCEPCHTTSAMGKLTVNSEESILRGGNSGAAPRGLARDSLHALQLRSDSPEPSGDPSDGRWRYESIVGYCRYRRSPKLIPSANRHFKGNTISRKR
jgi:hypothetical protein